MKKSILDRKIEVAQREYKFLVDWIREIENKLNDLLNKRFRR